MDLTFVSNEAKTLHEFFVSIFYGLAVILLLIGVLVEYFKMPLGGTPTFTQLIGRVFIAAMLLIAYPEISNTVADIADAIADKIGSINTMHSALSAAGENLKAQSWSWTSIGDTVVAAIAYLAYLILYISVFFFDAAIFYCTLLLYVFSPLMIAFFILPQTAGMTAGLFRALFEIAAWKIVFSVLGTLLWSSALSSFTHADGMNFITLIVLTLMLALSLLMTPIIVKNLISGTVSGIAAQTAGLATVGLSGGVLSPAGLAGLAKTKSAAGIKFAKGAAWKGAKASYRGMKKSPAFIRSGFDRKVEAPKSNDEYKK